MLSAGTWMGLELIILCELSPSSKGKHYMFLILLSHKSMYTYVKCKQKGNCPRGAKKKGRGKEREK